MHEVGCIDELPSLEGQALWISINLLYPQVLSFPCIKAASSYPPITAHLLRPMKAPSVAPGKPKSNDSKSSKGKKAAKKAAAKKPRKSLKGDKANGSKGE